MNLYILPDSFSNEVSDEPDDKHACNSTRQLIDFIDLNNRNSDSGKPTTTA